MSVHRRDYARELDPSQSSARVWAYAFSYRKYRYRQSGFRTKRDAELAEAAEKQKAMFEGKRPSVGCGDIGFTALVDKFFERRAEIRAANTVQGESYRVKPLKKHFGRTPISRIGIPEIEEYRSRRLRQGCGPRGINLEVMLLRCLFKLAIEHNLATVNPAKAVKELKVPKRDKPIPTDEELHRLVEAARATPSGNQLVVLLWLSAYTGLRPSEAFHLEWQDIDFNGGRIYVRPKEGHALKTGKFRAVEIHPALRPVLEEWKTEWQRFFADRGRGKEHDWLFYNVRKPGQGVQSLQKCFVEACKATGLREKGVTMYSLRHYFISKAIMSGIDLFTISRWSGHGSLKMLSDVYGHLTPEFRTQQMARLSIAPPPVATENAPPKTV